jgi:hypothetical protein
VGGDYDAPGVPSTRLERILAAVGVAATLALAALTAVAWAAYADAEMDTGAATAPTTQSVPTPTATEPAETSSVETRTTETSTTETQASEPEPPPSNIANLVLTAARGDCWLQVRVGSAGGELLYVGILEQSATRRFSGERLWLELGAPANLDARVNGEPLEFSDGPTTAVVTPEGLA